MKRSDAELDPFAENAPAGWPTVYGEVSLREGLSEVLAHGSDGLVVMKDGGPVVLLPLQRLRDASVTVGAAS